MSTLCLPHVHLRLGRIIELRSGTGDVWKNNDVSVAPNPHAICRRCAEATGCKALPLDISLALQMNLVSLRHSSCYVSYHASPLWWYMMLLPYFFAPMQIYTFLYVSVTKRFWDRCEWSLKSYFSDQWPGHISSITLNWYPRRCDAVQQFTAIFSCCHPLKVHGNLCIAHTHT